MFEMLVLFILLFAAAWLVSKYFGDPNAVHDQAIPNTADERFVAYEKRRYLFDATSEFKLYKILLELFGSRYHIFPQINYSHLVKPKKSEWTEERRSRSRIDRKSADFVLCDKQTVVPKLVIELDGRSHLSQKRQNRDEFIDGLMTAVGLPILHLHPKDLTPEFVRSEVNRKIL